jgi:NAD+ synthase
MQHTAQTNHDWQQFDRTLVKRIERLVLIAEYKRRQAAPGVKLTKKAFGIGRKYPITNGYRDQSVVPAPAAVAKQGIQ